jgi:hypothetical protein
MGGGASKQKVTKVQVQPPAAKWAIDDSGLLAPIMPVEGSTLRSLRPDGLPPHLETKSTPPGSTRGDDSWAADGGGVVVAKRVTKRAPAAATMPAVPLRPGLRQGSTHRGFRGVT